MTRYVQPALIALGGFLVAANWYVDPGRGWPWAIPLVFLVFLVVPLWFARRMPHHGRGRQTANLISNAVGFAAFMLVVMLSGTLAFALGAVDRDLLQRLSMVVVGFSLIFTGNAMPKTLTPLSVMRCSGAKVQAMQRFFGWTWVVTGLAYAIIWLVLPIRLAAPVSIMVFLAGTLAVATQVFFLRRARRTGA